MRLRTVGLWVTAANSLLTLGMIVFAFAGTMFFGPAAISFLNGLLLLAALTRLDATAPTCFCSGCCGDPVHVCEHSSLQWQATWWADVA